MSSPIEGIIVDAGMRSTVSLFCVEDLEGALTKIDRVLYSFDKWVHN